MGRRGDLISFGRQRYEWHKGFYNDNDPKKSLCEISYADYFKEPNDVNFAYGNAYPLLCGSCHLFALSLSKVFGYTPYLIESKDKKDFHAFCQTHKKHQLFYVDARGMTTSFDEFMDVAREFVSGEFSVREISPQDIAEWANNENYFEEALLFAETIIKDFEECYRV